MPSPAFSTTALARQISDEVAAMTAPSIVEPGDGSPYFLWCYDTGERGSDLGTGEAYDWAADLIDKKLQREDCEGKLSGGVE